VRACLRAANCPFVDERVQFAELGKRRGPTGYSPEVPLGQLPILTLANGLVLTQSQAIGRWAAKKAKLYGSNDDDQLIIDSVCDTISEAVSKAPQDPDKEQKKKLRFSFAESGLPKYLSYISSILEHTGGPYVLGKSFSYADILLFNFEENFAKGDFDFITFDMTIAKYPRLVEHHNVCKDHPVIKAEIAHDLSLKKTA